MPYKYFPPLGSRARPVPPRAAAAPCRAAAVPRTATERLRRFPAVARLWRRLPTAGNTSVRTPASYSPSLPARGELRGLKAPAPLCSGDAPPQRRPRVPPAAVSRRIWANGPDRATSPRSTEDP